MKQIKNMQDAAELISELVEYPPLDFNGTDTEGSDRLEVTAAGDPGSTIHYTLTSHSQFEFASASWHGAGWQTYTRQVPSGEYEVIAPPAEPSHVNHTLEDAAEQAALWLLDTSKSL